MVRSSIRPGRFPICFLAINLSKICTPLALFVSAVLPNRKEQLKSMFEAKLAWQTIS
ncbi:hypothetical protein C4J83_2210 [Pseudomonas sp. LBUM920]|nr:hypothetical protein C4J83_2210 [Pseudomonas sp. LBUM920]